jgi:hypothetical protein
VLTCYLLISGAAIPTERAFVMNGVVFAAILIDRAAHLDADLRDCRRSRARPRSGELGRRQLADVVWCIVALIAVYETFGGKRRHWIYSSRSIGIPLVAGGVAGRRD